MANDHQTHTITVGDTKTPLGVTLKQGNSVVDLTDCTVKFRMIDAVTGSDVVAETDTGVTVTDATKGECQYDFGSEDVDTAGIYYGWFTVYNSGDERDTFPCDGRKLRINIVEVA